MAINVGNSLWSAGVGVLDEGLEWWDEREGRNDSFRTAKDIGRLAGAFIGYGMQVFMPRRARFGEVLALSETPLLVKSLSKATVRRGAMATAGGARSFVPRRTATPASRPTGHQVPDLIVID